MPSVFIYQIEGRTQEQKRRVVEGITEVICKEYGVNKESVTIVFQDKSKDDWARGGKFFSELKP